MYHVKELKIFFQVINCSEDNWNSHYFYNTNMKMRSTEDKKKILLGLFYKEGETLSLYTACKTSSLRG